MGTSAVVISEAVLLRGRCTRMRNPVGAFDQGADGRAAVAADDEVSLEMAGFGPVLDLDRSSMDTAGSTIPDHWRR